MEPVHGDLRPAQLRLDAVPKLGKRLLAFGDEFDIYRRVEKRLPVALGGSDHGRHILQVALGLHHLPDIGAAGPEAVGLVRRLEDLSLLRRGNQPGVDPQGNTGPFPQPLEDGLFLGGRGVPPHRPDTAPGVAHEVAVGFKPHRCRRDEVEKGLKHLCLVHNTGGAVVAAAILHQPSLAVEVVVSLAHRIPGEVDGEDALEVLPVRPSHRKLLLPDHLFQPVQVGIYLFLVDAPGPNQEDKLPGSSGAALDLVQMAKVLFQQGADLRDGFLLHPAGEVLLVVLKALPGVEAEQFDFSKPLQDVHQGIHPGPQSLPGEHRHIGGFQQKKHNLIPLEGDEAALSDGFQVHQLAGAIGPPLIFQAFEQVFDGVSPPVQRGKPSGTAGASAENIPPLCG